MKEFVSNRRVMILAWAASLSILWAILVIPSGRPWSGLVWLGALAFLLVSSAALLLGAAAPTPLARVIRGAEDGPTRRKS